jgi:hypothetical protein
MASNWSNLPTFARRNKFEIMIKLHVDIQSVKKNFSENKSKYP